MACATSPHEVRADQQLAARQADRVDIRPAGQVHLPRPGRRFGFQLDSGGNQFGAHVAQAVQQRAVRIEPAGGGEVHHLLDVAVLHVPADFLRAKAQLLPAAGIGHLGHGGGGQKPARKERDETACGWLAHGKASHIGINRLYQYRRASAPPQGGLTSRGCF
jgi:hypothetical protein